MSMVGARIAVAGQLHHGSRSGFGDGIVGPAAPVPVGQCGRTDLAVSREEALGVTLAHSHDLGSLGDGKLVFQNAVEHLNPCLFLLIQRYILHKDDIFADQLAGDRIVEHQHLDAALYEPAPPRQPGQNGRPPLKGRRLPALKTLLDQPQVTWASAEVAWYDGITRAVELTSQTAVWYRSGKPPVPLRWVLVRDPQGEFTPQALLCTDPSADPTQILEWFVLRWQLEVTFQEVRAHLGVETQRQWSDLAIARTTPALLGLFSWTTLAAHLLRQQRPSAHRTAAWYAKPSPTFVDAIALVRRHLWLASEGFSLSAADPDIRKVPAALYHRLVDSLAYAA